LTKYIKLVFVLVIVLALTGCNTLLSDHDIPEGEKDSPEFTEFKEFFSYDGLLNDADQNTILVKSKDIGNLEMVLADLGSTLINRWDAIDWAQVSVPSGKDLPQFLETIQKEEDIILAQPNLQYELPFYEKMSERDVLEFEERLLEAPNIGADDFEKHLWGMKNINAERAWEITTGNENVVVAIVDTGVDTAHPEFDYNEFVAPFNATDDPFPENIDWHGHGTHVAGTAVADGRTGNIAGVSWDNPIMPIRVMNYETGGILSSYTIDGIFHIIDYMQENDVRVVANYSIGGRGYDAAMKDALDYGMEEGMIWVTSAGNDGKRVPNLPATYNGLISVAASTPWDEKADFSTTGFWNSVAAPGVHIWSTHLDEDFVHMQGTSMASPHVTGAVALLLSENPDLTAVEVLNQVEQTARGDGFSEELGYGILNVHALLGDLAPVNYGSLELTTNAPGARMTVFDANGNMVGFAAIGPELIRKIHALEQGDYTVNLTRWDVDTEEWETLQEEVIIDAEDIVELEMEF